MNIIWWFCDAYAVIQLCSWQTIYSNIQLYQVITLHGQVVEVIALRLRPVLNYEAFFDTYQYSQHEILDLRSQSCHMDAEQSKVS